MGFQRRIRLFFSFGLLSLLATAMMAWGDTLQFGREGKTGEPGETGNDGNNSENLTIFADGSPLNLNLSGDDGFNGENGTSGTAAVCPVEFPEEIYRNLRGADGGDGGDGGNGGNGGSGGDITIYATNPDYLQQIYVLAAGGQGGQAGLGGDGGPGCQCPQPYWTQRVCQGDPGDDDYRCTTEEFSCQDGYDGRKGRDGQQGRQGLSGSLTLIQLDKSLTSDRPVATVDLSQLKDLGYTVSRNVWESRTGAANLFAPGSVIADGYRVLTERIEHTFLLLWDAPQPFQEFAHKTITLSLSPQGIVEISPDKSIWLEGKVSQQRNLTQMIVFNAVESKRVTRLKIEDLSGSGSDLKLSVVDRAAVSDLVHTEFSLRYQVSKSGQGRSQPVYDHGTVYESRIPSDLVELDSDRFTIFIGRLPIDPKYLEADTSVELELIVTRSLGSNWAEQRLDWRQTL